MLCLQEGNSSAESPMVHDKEDQEIFNVHTKFEYGEMGVSCPLLLE
jgi:hypothetical protein